MAHLGDKEFGLLSVVKVIFIVAAVILTTADRTYAAHSGAECYRHGRRIYVPDGLNYPRQAWAGWGIRVVDRDHVLAISGNDHNDVRTRIRLTSDVIGWRDVTEENTAADKPVVDTATDETAAHKTGSDKNAVDASVQDP